MPRVDAGLIRRLEALVDGMDECVEAGDIVRYTELNRDFHLRLFERAYLPRLYHMIEVLWQARGRRRTTGRYSGSARPGSSCGDRGAGRAQGQGAG